MKLTVEEDASLKETEITIKCREKDEKINKLIEMISTYYINVTGKKDGENYRLSLDDIYYFEAVENRVFAYVKKDVYEVNYKIVELEEVLKNTSFIRVSRTVILNILKIERVSTLVNGRILACLDNGEKMIITRLYAKEFKRKLQG